MDRLLEPLSRCTWVGVSVDAGTVATYGRLKQVACFDRVLENIRQLNTYAASHDCKLGRRQAGSGVSYKYLLSPENVADIIPAARLAKELGCASFHLRPASVSWHSLSGQQPAMFCNGENRELESAIAAVRPLEDATFGVYGITHKFDANLNSTNCFERCHAVFMTCVVMPPRADNDERFRLGLCCDRRGDSQLEAAITGCRVEEIAEFWGSDRHWALFDAIDLADCPRCTYQPHNQIMEHVVLNDNMTYKFI